MISYRSYEPARDEAGLRRLDTGFSSDTTYRVRVSPTGFELLEEPADPPLAKRYSLSADEIASSDLAWVAEQDGELLGIGALRPSGWNLRGEIVHLYVARSARGLGIGAELLRRLGDAARPHGLRCLWVETQNVNAPAIRFYRRMGFALCGLDTSLYDPEAVPGETALFFSRPL
jgi:ribosomal protein S18 acetylase RimI-like enzyme